MAGQCLPWHCCGMFHEGWHCWSVFFEAAWLFQRVGGADRVSLKQGGLPEGRQDWEFHTTMEADFTWPGRAFSGVYVLWGFLQEAGSAGQLFHRSAAPPMGWSSSLGH